jgi:hypothetical protein
MSITEQRLNPALYRGKIALFNACMEHLTQNKPDFYYDIKKIHEINIPGLAICRHNFMNWVY